MGGFGFGELWGPFFQPIESLDFREVPDCEIIWDFWSREVEGFERREEIAFKLQFLKQSKLFIVYEKEYTISTTVMRLYACETLSTRRVWGEDASPDLAISVRPWTDPGSPCFVSPIGKSLQDTTLH